MREKEAREIWRRFGSERVKALNAQGISRKTFVALAVQHGDAVFESVDKYENQKTATA